MSGASKDMGKIGQVFKRHGVMRENVKILGVTFGRKLGFKNYVFCEWVMGCELGVGYAPWQG